METVIRVVLMYLLILVGLRIMGKREVSEFSPMDLIVLLLIPELVSQALLGDDYSLANAVVAVTTLLTLVLAISLVSYMSHRAERVLEGSPRVLVEHGRVVTENLQRERITPDELLAHLRQAGLERVDQVQWAIMENDGKISIIAGTGQEKDG